MRRRGAGSPRPQPLGNVGSQGVCLFLSRCPPPPVSLASAVSRVEVRSCPKEAVGGAGRPLRRWAGQPPLPRCWQETAARRHWSGREEGAPVGPCVLLPGDRGPWRLQNTPRRLSLWRPATGAQQPPQESEAALSARVLVPPSLLPAGSPRGHCQKPSPSGLRARGSSGSPAPGGVLPSGRTSDCATHARPVCPTLLGPWAARLLSCPVL